MMYFLCAATVFCALPNAVATTADTVEGIVVEVGVKILVWTDLALGLCLIA